MAADMKRMSGEMCRGYEGALLAKAFETALRSRRETNLVYHDASENHARKACRRGLLRHVLPQLAQ